MTSTRRDSIRFANCRAGLLLVNGQIFLTWASSCDVGSYHGWVIAYDKRTLASTVLLNTSPALERAASELYHSEESSCSRDRAGPALRFAVPTVMHGRIYVGTKGEVDAYGLISAK